MERTRWGHYPQRGRRGRRGHTQGGPQCPLSGYCPDCDSQSRLDQDAHGVWHLHVHHDATCPTYRATIMDGDF